MIEHESTASLLRRILHSLRKHCTAIIAAGCLIAADAALNLPLPFMAGKLIDLGRAAHPGHALGGILLILAAIAVVKYGCAAGALALLGDAAVRFSRQLRSDMYERMIKAPLAFHTRRPIGELMTLLVNEASFMIGLAFDQLPNVISRLMILVGGMAMLLWMDWRLTIWLVVFAPPAVWVVRIIGRRLRSAAVAVQQRLGEVSSLATEYLHNVHTVKAFGYEDQAHGAVTDRLDAMLAAARRRVGLQTLLRPLTGLMTFLVLCALISAGAWALEAGLTTPGALVSYLLYAGIVGTAATGLAGMFGTLQEAAAAAGRIVAFMEEPIGVDAPMAAAPSAPVSGAGRIEFSRVRFSYTGDTDVVNDLSFRIPAGRTIALIGPSGAGKSTILKLLLRLYEPQAGSILVDGVDLSTIPHQDWRRRIGYVPQDPVLFRGTIRSNLLFGVPEASPAAIEDAARAAGIHEFINSLPGGYDTSVGEGGVTLSTGQRQRIAIARILLKKPSLLLLDEPTAALDKDSEECIRRLLASRLAGRTILFVAHTPRLLDIADGMIVFNEDQGSWTDVQSSRPARAVSECV